MNAAQEDVAEADREAEAMEDATTDVNRKYQ